MEVNKISATIRYSQDTGKGSWKVVELGAEASISDREFWQQAQSELYYQLTQPATHLVVQRKRYHFKRQQRH